MKNEIAKAIALLQTEYDIPPFSKDRIDMWMKALSRFPAGSVTASVQKHIMSNRFKPQLADIVAGCSAQLDADWLGHDEAWSLMPKSESDSAMLTDEMAQAMASASSLLASRDQVAARMAFKDAYTRLVERAKLEGRKPVYFPSFGSEPAGRVSMLANAVNAKQISLDRATQALPEYAPDLVQMLGVKNHPLLAPADDKTREKVKALLLTLKVSA